MVSKELLNELQIILFEDFGIDINDDDLFEIGSQLLGFFETLAKIEHEPI